MNDKIRLLESAIGYKLSSEQVAILQSGFKNPTLVNACAGAGKTTTMILSIFYQALTGGPLPYHVMCLTFSNKACADMKLKYESLRNQLAVVYPQAAGWDTPIFRTFHSTFFQALRRLYPTHPFTLINWTRYTYDLYHTLKHPKDALTQRENLERYLNLHSQLINHSYTYDGLNINRGSHTVSVILENLHQDGKSDLDCLLNYFGLIDENSILDYKRVIKKYNDIKAQNLEIDFNDMQTMLSNAINHDVNGRKYLQELHAMYNARLQQIYLDEFQDISPIQWNLIRQIIPGNVANHIVAIGDDDQSIYRFRGSDPTFILNFAKHIPNAKQYNLSTNYRTYSNILNVTKPMIESNTLRLTKQLKAFNAGGDVEVYTRSSMENDPALKRLVRDIKAHPEKKYAILARNNSSLSLLTDYLASQELYSNLGNSEQYILQNSKIYKILMGIMHSLYHDDFDEFVKYSNRIGFTFFKNFLTQYQNKVKTISEALDQDKLLTDLQNFGKLNKQSPRILQEQADRLLNIKSLMSQINEFKQADDDTTKKYLPRIIFKNTLRITKDYFSYMLKHHYLGLGAQEFTNLKNYLSDLAHSSTSCDAMFAQEELKRINMTAEAQNENPEKAPIKAMTFHRSKGLEFDETLVYTDETGAIDDLAYELNEYFPANLTIDQTMDKIIAEPAYSLALMDANDLASIARIKQTLFGLDDEAAIRFDTMLAQIEASNFEYLPKLNIDEEKLAEDEDLKKLIFLEINSIAKNVEEEKRLLYVAVTRAKDKAIFDCSVTKDIISQQLVLPHGKMEVNDTKEKDD